MVWYQWSSFKNTHNRHTRTHATTYKFVYLTEHWHVWPPRALTIIHIRLLKEVYEQAMVSMGCRARLRRRHWMIWEIDVSNSILANNSNSRRTIHKTFKQLATAAASVGGEYALLMTLNRCLLKIEKKAALTLTHSITVTAVLWRRVTTKQLIFVCRTRYVNSRRKRT